MIWPDGVSVTKVMPGKFALRLSRSVESKLETVILPGSSRFALPRPSAQQGEPNGGLGGLCIGHQPLSAEFRVARSIRVGFSPRDRLVRSASGLSCPFLQERPKQGARVMRESFKRMPKPLPAQVCHVALRHPSPVQRLLGSVAVDIADQLRRYQKSLVRVAADRASPRR